jgi:uncharacterized protein (TIGR02145 family)
MEFNCNEKRIIMKASDILMCGNNKEIDGYGLLYNWFTVEGNASNLITDLHVPSDTEWSTLETYLTNNGYSGAEGGALKEVGTTHWDSPNTGAVDAFGFTALPSGYRDGNDGLFYNMGSSGSWWSNTEFSSISTYFRALSYTNADVYRGYNNKSTG